MEIPFDCLADSDLSPGDVLGSGNGSLAQEPINEMFEVGNQGGIRFLGGVASGYKLAVLYTTHKDVDWPDELDSDTGQLVYYGDNKKPGRDLLDTPKHGNKLLQHVFEIIHARPEERHGVPPFFVALRAGRSRDVIYRGLAAPGAPGVPESEDLLAIWRTKGRQRFQNYRAIYTILDAPRISADWIRDLRQGRGSVTANAPLAWRQWVDAGTY